MSRNKKKKKVKSVSTKVESNVSTFFVLDELDDYRAYVKLKVDGKIFAYLEWFPGEGKMPMQWMLAELSWLTSINEVKNSQSFRKVVSAIDILKLAEFISEESVKKANIIKDKIVDNAESLVNKAVNDIVNKDDRVSSKTAESRSTNDGKK